MNNGEVLDLPHYPPTQTDIDSGKATPSGKAVKNVIRIQKYRTYVYRAT